MRRKETLRTLNNVVEVRRLQRSAGEQALTEATLASQQALVQRDGAADAFDARQADWLGAVTSGRLDPRLLGAHADAVLKSDLDLRNAGVALSNAEDLQDSRREALRRAEAMNDAAEQLRDAAGRADRRLREESRLGEIADHAARRGQGR